MKTQANKYHGWFILISGLVAFQLSYFVSALAYTAAAHSWYVTSYPKYRRHRYRWTTVSTPELRQFFFHAKMNTFSLQLIIFGSNFSPAVPYLSVRLFGKLDIISRRLFVKEMIHLADYDTVLEMPIIGKNHRRRRPKVWSALAVARCYLLMSGDYCKSLLNTKDQTVNGNQIAWYFKNVCKAQRKDKTETNVKKQHKAFFF